MMSVSTSLGPLPFSFILLPVILKGRGSVNNQIVQISLDGGIHLCPVLDQLYVVISEYFDNVSAESILLMTKY